MKISEANIQRAIIDLLDAKKIMHFRMNAGDRFGETNGRKWRIRGHKPGTADLLALISLAGCATVTLWIEVKAPGKKQSPAQLEFQREVEEYGCDYLLADSIDVVTEWFKSFNKRKSG